MAQVWDDFQFFFSLACSSRAGQEFWYVAGLVLSVDDELALFFEAYFDILRAFFHLSGGQASLSNLLII